MCIYSFNIYQYIKKVNWKQAIDTSPNTYPFHLDSSLKVIFIQQTLLSKVINMYLI